MPSTPESTRETLRRIAERLTCRSVYAQAAIRMEQSKWILQGLTGLLLVIAFLGVTGCKPPHH